MKITYGTEKQIAWANELISDVQYVADTMPSLAQALISEAVYREEKRGVSEKTEAYRSAAAQVLSAVEYFNENADDATLIINLREKLSPSKMVCAIMGIMGETAHENLAQFHGNTIFVATEGGRVVASQKSIWPRA